MWKGLQNFQDLCNNMKCSLINLCLKLDFYDKQLDELLGEKGNAFKGEGKQVHLRNCYISLSSIHQYLQTLPLGSLWTLLRTRMLILIMMQRHERKGNKLNLCFSINVKTQIERNCFLFLILLKERKAFFWEKICQRSNWISGWEGICVFGNIQAWSNFLGNKNVPIPRSSGSEICPLSQNPWHHFGIENFPLFYSKPVWIFFCWMTGKCFLEKRLSQFCPCDKEVAIVLNLASESCQTNDFFTMHPFQIVVWCCGRPTLSSFSYFQIYWRHYKHMC